MFDQFTLGIEEEFQIVDPRTRELRSHVSEFLEEGKMLLGEQIKPEMIQSMVEVGTGICKNRSEEHTSELQSLAYLVCRLLLEKKKNYMYSDPVWSAGLLRSNSMLEHARLCLSDSNS